MRRRGHIHNWNDARGFGFIRPLEGGPEVFVHISSFVPGYPRPLDGQAVSFEVTQVQDRLRARLVMLEQVVRQAPLPRPEPLQPPASRAEWIAIPAFGCLWWMLSTVWQPPAFLLPLYLGASLVCLLLYALDKRAAIAHRRRVPEATLHLWALVGGWPGGLLAQHLFRHKTSKQPFRQQFWMMVGINIGFFVWSASPLGAAALRI